METNLSFFSLNFPFKFDERINNVIVTERNKFYIDKKF